MTRNNPRGGESWRTRLARAGDNIAKRVPKCLDGSQCLGSQEGFELGESLLDRVQIGTVGWQVVQSGADGFDCLADSGDLVGTQIVRDHDVAPYQRETRPAKPAADRPHRAPTHCFELIFGAICPERGVGAGLVLPWCNSATMSLHLAEVSQAVSPGAHAVVLLDQAGWHTSPKLNVPANISLLALPPSPPS